MFYEKPVVSQKTVLKMMQAALQKASELEINVNVAIMDDGGNLKAFVRMDNAPLLSSEIAQNKAYTAVAFGIPTADWYPMIQKQPSLLHGIVHTNRLVIFGGGLPMHIGKHLVGGIGVSGGTAEQDVMIAEATLAIFEEDVKQHMLNERKRA